MGTSKRKILFKIGTRFTRLICVKCCDRLTHADRRECRFIQGYMYCEGISVARTLLAH